MSKGATTRSSMHDTFFSMLKKYVDISLGANVCEVHLSSLDITPVRASELCELCPSVQILVFKVNDCYDHFPRPTTSQLVEALSIIMSKLREHM